MPESPPAIDTQFVWEAIYTQKEAALPEWERLEDGTLVKHWFREIDLGRCTAMVLHALVEGVPDIAVKIDPASGQRPIFFRRYPTEYDFETGETRALAPIHVLGWQRTIEGTNVAHYTYIFPDGSILLSDDHQAV